MSCPPPKPLPQHQTPRIKICGITNLEDANIAASAGADFLGYIFYPKSARHMETEGVREIVLSIKAEYPGIRHVAVMVNPTPAEVESTLREGSLDIAQLHGEENADTVTEICALGITVMKAFRFATGSPEVRWKDYSSDYYLCDSFTAAMQGGSGHSFDHNLLPKDLPRDRMFLAGGLTPDNVSSAISQVRPFAVDVSSGVEVSPGRKSAEAIQRFIRAVKSTD